MNSILHKKDFRKHLIRYMFQHTKYQMNKENEVINVMITHDFKARFKSEIYLPLDLLFGSLVVN